MKKFSTQKTQQRLAGLPNPSAYEGLRAHLETLHESTVLAQEWLTDNYDGYFATSLVATAIEELDGAARALGYTATATLQAQTTNRPRLSRKSLPEVTNPVVLPELPKLPQQPAGGLSDENVAKYLDSIHAAVPHEAIDLISYTFDEQFPDEVRAQLSDQAQERISAIADAILGTLAATDRASWALAYAVEYAPGDKLYPNESPAPSARHGDRRPSQDRDRQTRMEALLPADQQRQLEEQRRRPVVDHDAQRRFGATRLPKSSEMPRTRWTNGEPNSDDPGYDGPDRRRPRPS